MLIAILIFLWSLGEYAAGTEGLSMKFCDNSFNFT